MTSVIAEPVIGVQQKVASGSLKVVPDKSELPDERSFALSSIKYPSEPVLDVGTGGCACVACRLALRNMQVVALDKDRGTISAARKFLTKHHVSKAVRLMRDDITASSLPSNSFRNIVCFNVLHHVSALDSALGELHRILAEDGRLIISDFDENRDRFLVRLKQAVDRHFGNVTAYRRRFKRLVLICEK